MSTALVHRQGYENIIGFVVSVKTLASVVS